MIDCKNLIHPFQHDPGVSQRQRIIDDLLSGPAKIDGRTWADLLDYFKQLSRHVNYYDADLSVSDWQPFFQKSIPFSIAAITKYNHNKVDNKIRYYHQLFEKHSSPSGLQLLVHYLYYRAINSINTWYLQVQGSELPVAFALEKLIKDKLRNPVRQFIALSNAAVKWYCIKPIDFNRLYDNEVWDLDFADLYTIDESFKSKGNTKRERIIALYDAILNLLPAFLDVIRVVADTAALSIEQSLVPLKAELQEKHPPHLAILFAFLKLFQYLQHDLNSFTKKHLDFFYKQVLQLQTHAATPDKAHILFEIQNQLNKYKLEKGLQVKDGKDNNKAEVFFALDDEIVVNKTQVADKRTLFLNHQTVYDTTYVEGVYMAPNADKADGIDKDFKEDTPKSFATLGAKNSKYTDPEHKFTLPYPNARLGFILASPVLLLNEGTRTVNIQLACILDKDVCVEDKNNRLSDPCCDQNSSATQKTKADKTNIKLIKPEEIIDNINKVLKTTYIFISQALINEAEKKGIDKEIAVKIKRRFLTDKCYEPICCNKERKYLSETAVRWGVWLKFLNLSIKNLADQKALNEIFKPRRVFHIFFSGEKEWITPDVIKKIALVKQGGNDKFMLHIDVTVNPDKPAITFYDKEKLKEDFNTIIPLVKIELDSDLGIVLNKKLRKQLKLEKEDNLCCLYKTINLCADKISFYDFFKYVKVIEKLGEDPEDETDETRLNVKVCGLKNFVVQNDESVQDVNGIIYPFGTRPEIIDFDIKQPPALPLHTNLNLIGPNFYIGSKEVFCKKWEDVYINIVWKDKPTDFHDYYKGYLKDGGLFGLDEDKFLVNLSILEEGQWKKEGVAPATIAVTIMNIDYNDRKLFEDNGEAVFCKYTTPMQTIRLNNSFFALDQKFRIDGTALIQNEVNTSNGFLKLNLQLQDFCHKVYSYVLARQMMALGKLPDSKIEDAIYYDPSIGGLILFSTNTIKSDLAAAGVIAARVEDDVNNNPDGIKVKAGPLGSGNIPVGRAQDIRKIILPPDILNPLNKNLSGDVTDLKDRINTISGIIEDNDKFQAVIPNEPWTPVIKEISLDYTATATTTDIDLIHLYPYEGTYKHEEIELQPTLFPTFCDEGTLFLGLKNLVPGSNIHMLFQLAEATADSESEREEIHWYYLDNNQWKMLRQGFEVLDDATNGLTASGIIKFALPANMTSDNTILPKGLHWIKAAIPYNSHSVSETIGIHTQAIQVTFTNEEANDKLRLAKALPAGSIAKLKEADASVKKVNQPYDSFGGRVPEAEGHFYVRVSELLRHKGRAIQKFDYERLALEAFPQLFKVKCINHSFALDAHQYFNDFPVAPGYVLLAVIPDLHQLKAAQSFEPRVPMSLLEDIKTCLHQRTSPFVRLRVMNPRYEEVHFCLKVKLYLGKDEQYYKEKLKQDVREFLAPWAVGQYDKLTFGQCIYRSDIVRFLETRDYLDYILDLRMKHAYEPGSLIDQPKVCPVTPRSILIAGDIDVCIKQQDCEEWQEEDCEHEKIPLMDYCKEERIV